MRTCWFCNNKLRKVRDFCVPLAGGGRAAGTVYRCDKETCDSQKQFRGYVYSMRGERCFRWGQPEGEYQAAKHSPPPSR